MKGENERDFLYGGKGNDTLLGGYGNDKLKGGLGNDSFVFNTHVTFNSDTIGIDIIADFGDRTDVIELDKTTFTALTSQAGSGFSNANEFAVVSEDSLVAASDAFIVYSSSTGGLFYNENSANAGLGNGGQFAILSNNPDLLANNFQIAD